MTPADPEVDPNTGRTAPRERVLTLPLALFLTAVAATLAVGFYGRLRVPGIEEAVSLLADGDLDGTERERMLRITVVAARKSDDVTWQWAGLLAAVALDDRSAHAALAQRLGGVAPPSKVPPPERREWLALGDPMLANVLRAMLAEAAGDRAEAARRWRQVETQSRWFFRKRALAGELAAAGIARSS
jgi:hypothetical protein